MLPPTAVTASSRPSISPPGRAPRLPSPSTVTAPTRTATRSTTTTRRAPRATSFSSNDRSGRTRRALTTQLLPPRAGRDRSRLHRGGGDPGHRLRDRLGLACEGAAPPHLQRGHAGAALLGMELRRKA